MKNKDIGTELGVEVGPDVVGDALYTVIVGRN